MEQGLLGWPKGRNKGLRVQVDSFAVTGSGPYALTAVPDGALVLGFFDGILQPKANYLVSGATRQAVLPANVTPANIQTFTLAYTVGSESLVSAGAPSQAVTLAGDVAGPVSANTVGKIQGQAVLLGNPPAAPLVYTSQGNYAWGAPDRTFPTQSYTLSTSAATVAVYDTSPFKANQTVLFVNGSSFFSATVNSVSAAALTFTWNTNDGAVNGTVFGAGTLVRLPKLFIVKIGPIASPATGADTEEVPFPKYLGQSVNYVGISQSVRCQTAGSTTTTGNGQISTGSGAFSSAQSCTAVSVAGSSSETLDSAFTAGGAVTSGNKLRWNWSAVGTGVNNIEVEMVWGFSG